MKLLLRIFSVLPLVHSLAQFSLKTRISKIEAEADIKVCETAEGKTEFFSFLQTGCGERPQGTNSLSRVLEIR
jgi:hypothetical protein